MELLLKDIKSDARLTLVEWFKILGMKATFDDRDRVFTFAEWVVAANISPRNGRELIAAGKGPPVVQLSDNRIGIRVCDHRDWLAKRTIKGARS
jgi:hypothetical protein